MADEITREELIASESETNGEREATELFQRERKVNDGLGCNHYQRGTLEESDIL